MKPRTRHVVKDSSIAHATGRTFRSFWQLIFALPLAALTSLSGCSLRGCGERPATWLERAEDELAQRVRRGELAGVTHHQFHSQRLDADVGLLVATPPEYTKHVERQVPAVYVFPGIGGDEWSYLRETMLHDSTMKRLFRDPSSAPLVVFANPGDSGAHGVAEDVLADELVAFVDATYRTRRKSSARSLQGFSLGGVTALTLLTKRPDVFGRAVALSSACFLLSSCDALRTSLRKRAKRHEPPRVLLSVGAEESDQIREANEELAPLFGVALTVLPRADHNLGQQLATRVGDVPFGERIADFHLQGFAR